MHKREEAIDKVTKTIILSLTQRKYTKKAKLRRIHKTKKKLFKFNSKN